MLTAQCIKKMVSQLLYVKGVLLPHVRELNWASLTAGSKWRVALHHLQELATADSNKELLLENKKVNHKVQQVVEQEELPPSFGELDILAKIEAEEQRFTDNATKETPEPKAAPRDYEKERRLFVMNLYREMLKLAFISYPGNPQCQSYAWNKVRSDFRRHSSYKDEIKIDTCFIEAYNEVLKLSAATVSAQQKAIQRTTFLQQLQHQQVKAPPSPYDFSQHFPPAPQPTPASSPSVKLTPTTTPSTPPSTTATQTNKSQTSPITISSTSQSQSSPSPTVQESYKAPISSQSPIPSTMNSAPSPPTSSTSQTYSGGEVFQYALKNKVNVQSANIPTTPVIQADSQPIHPLPSTPVATTPSPPSQPTKPSTVSASPSNNSNSPSPAPTYRFPYQKEVATAPQSSSEARNQFYKQYSELQTTLTSK